jgi:transforming growth factor-beta-induced protein
MKKILVLSILSATLISACAAPVAEQEAPVVEEVTEKPVMEEAVMEEKALPDIVDTAVAAGSFETLVAAVQAAGLVDALKGEGPFTVFAPSDEAFAKLPEGTLDALLADPQGQLSRILLYHVVPGKVMAADVSDGLTAETLRGADVAFSVSDGKVMINDAEIVATDIEASNGVIHVIDSVILPPDDLVDVAVGAGSFNSLAAAVQAAGLEETLRSKGPFTVFAPTDEAFAKLPEGTVEALLADPEALADILLYHVLPGKVMVADVSDGMMADTAQGSSVSFAIHSDGAPAINDALITATDIEAFNGVIHVIDTVLLPPEDIVDTAIEAGSFNTLVSAVQAAGLEEALRGDGPFTVFAPTDDAFAKLPEGTLNALLADPATLADILLYHVLPGKVMAAGISDGLEAETLQGSKVVFAIHSDSTPAINDALIVATDIMASNGVIHVIDSVILPPAE